MTLAPQILNEPALPTAQSGHFVSTDSRDLRFARARQLLEGSRLSVEVIAGQLGHAESAAFIHAFQRWSVSSRSLRCSLRKLAGLRLKSC